MKGKEFLKGYWVIIIVIILILIGVIWQLIPRGFGVTFKLEKIHSYNPWLNFTISFLKVPEEGMYIRDIWVDDILIMDWPPITLYQGDKCHFQIEWSRSYATVPMISFGFCIGFYQYNDIIKFPLLEGKEFNY